MGEIAFFWGYFQVEKFQQLSRKLGGIRIELKEKVGGKLFKRSFEV